MAILEIKVPDIGDFAEVTVIELMVKPGDSIKPEQSLITVESDKASITLASRSHRIIGSRDRKMARTKARDREW